MEIEQEVQSYIDFLNEGLINIDSSFMIRFLESILKGIEVEKKFPGILKKNNREVIKYLTDIMPLLATNTKEENYNIIKSFFNRHYDVNDPVRNSLFYMSGIPEVKEYLGLNI